MRKVHYVGGEIYRSNAGYIGSTGECWRLAPGTPYEAELLREYVLSQTPMPSRPDTWAKRWTKNVKVQYLDGWEIDYGESVPADPGGWYHVSLRCNPEPFDAMRIISDVEYVQYMACVVVDDRDRMSVCWEYNGELAYPSPNVGQYPQLPAAPELQRPVLPDGVDND